MCPTGTCSDPAKPDGTGCDDGNGCTQGDTCQAGRCTGGDPRICTALDQCHDRGTCDPATGTCSTPTKADGTLCDDGDGCTEADVCVEGICVGNPLPDSDADGYCDVLDVCPVVPDPEQSDANGNGVGDFCECTAPSPGRCIAGGGSERTDCLLEVTTTGPVTLNRRGTRVKRVVRCIDGEVGCDLDGAYDGQCTFGVAFCFGNSDPRYPGCTPSMIRSMEILLPNAARAISETDRANAQQLERSLGALGLEVRRRRRVIAEPIAPVGQDLCSPVIRLTVPGPRVRGGKTVRRKFRFRATATDGRRDKDRLILVCE
jgi:hypothetical protein